MQRNKDFWKSFAGPVVSLAPMEDVTDTVFRELILHLTNPGRLHVLMTEFTSTDGLCHEVGRPNVIQRLLVNDSEKKLLKEKNVKLVAQIWGSDPEKFSRSVKYIYDHYDFDGIDINMGCPVKKIVKQGGCAALIRQPDLAREIIQASREASPLPVSVKTRIGFHKTDTENWIGNLLEAEPAALTVHGRIQKDQSLVPANWEEIRKSVELKNKMKPHIPLFGNGDLWSYQDGLEKTKSSGADGFMIGRGIFGNPWIFSAKKELPDIQERLKILLLHNSLFAKTWEGKKNDAIMKRFYKIYVNSFRGASELRARLMDTSKLAEADEIIRSFLTELS